MVEGQLITPTLRLARMLGRGAMGSVWVADHLGLGTHVAVKFMAPALAQNASLVQRFQREATTAAQIKSPHIAQVFDHGLTFHGIPYIVMELLEGEDLGKRVRRAGSLVPRDAAEVVGQVAKALTRTHQLGIVHRDIKPDNIFLVTIDEEIMVKLLDFGIAKLGSDPGLALTSTGNLLGTPLFMSPEQLLSAKHVDHRADLWALGVVAYFTLTGRAPFTGETVGSLAIAVHRGVFQPVSSMRTDLPRTIDTWFGRALQRDPGHRFASAKELAEEFAQALGTTSGAPFSVRVPRSVSFGAPPSAPSPAGAPSTPEAAPPPSHGPEVPSSLEITPAPGRTLSGTSTTHVSASSRRVPPALAAILLMGATLAVVLLGVVRPRPSSTSPATAPGPDSLSDSTSALRALTSGGPAIATAAPRVTISPPPAAIATAGATASIRSAEAHNAGAHLPIKATAPVKGESPRRPTPTKSLQGTTDTIGF